MTKSDQDSFYYKLEQLENLVQRQQEALEIATNLLDMKSKLVELCEEETELYKKETEFYKKECKILRKSLIISGVIFSFLAVLNLARLLF